MKDHAQKFDQIGVTITNLQVVLEEGGNLKKVQAIVTELEQIHDQTAQNYAQQASLGRVDHVNKTGNICLALSDPRLEALGIQTDLGFKRG